MPQTPSEPRSIVVECQTAPCPQNGYRQRITYPTVAPGFYAKATIVCAGCHVEPRIVERSWAK